MVTVLVSNDVHFRPFFDWRGLALILIWEAETNLKNITWNRWITITKRWPFFRKVSFFSDDEAEVYYKDFGNAPE